MSHPDLIENLIHYFTALPSIGPKTAEKLVYALVKKPKEFKESFAETIRASEWINRCSECCTLTTVPLCDQCADPSRENGVLCVVADPQDVAAVEKTKKFSGRYHVLGGLISPLEGVSQKHLTIDALMRRIKKIRVREVILAFDQTAQGETTVLALTKILKNLGVTVSVPARGLPVGSDLEYADDITLGSAIESRKEI